MATPVLMPKQGNTVESCILLEWTKKEGDTVSAGETLCEAETDKATIEVEAPESGVLLKTFFNADDDVPVQTVIAVIGEAGEDFSSFAPAGEAAPAVPDAPADSVEPSASAVAPAVAPSPSAPVQAGGAPVSPRARNLAAAKGVDTSILAGTGPAGRIIERDITAALGDREPLTPAAIAALVAEGKNAPASGTGIGGRVLASDLGTAAPPAAAQGSAAPAAAFPGTFTDEAVKGVRKVIASRMMGSLSAAAQLTNNICGDASALLAYRKKLKSSSDEVLQKISLNDMILYLTSRILKNHRVLNSHWLGDTIRFFDRVHLGFAVDTPKGLLVPVIRNADLLTLKEISVEARRLAAACRDGKAAPEELTGATFTISNLGTFGIESFTPLINPPEVGILGVCTTELKPVEVNGEVVFKPHMGLSLTYDHQAVDGAPASRFLADFKKAMADFELILAG